MQQQQIWWWRQTFCTLQLQVLFLGHGNNQDHKFWNLCNGQPCSQWISETRKKGMAKRFPLALPPGLMEQGEKARPSVFLVPPIKMPFLNRVYRTACISLSWPSTQPYQTKNYRMGCHRHRHCFGRCPLPRSWREFVVLALYA